MVPHRAGPALLFSMLTTWRHHCREFHFTMDTYQKVKVKLPHLGFICPSVRSYTEQHTISPLTFPLSHLSPPRVSHRVTYLGFRIALPRGMISLSRTDKWFLGSPSSGTLPGKEKDYHQICLSVGGTGTVLEISVLGPLFCSTYSLPFNPTRKMVCGFNPSLKIHHKVCLIAEKMEGN